MTLHWLQAASHDRNTKGEHVTLVIYIKFYLCTYCIGVTDKFLQSVDWKSLGSLTVSKETFCKIYFYNFTVTTSSYAGDNF
jgi:hypothetical protein